MSQSLDRSYVENRIAVREFIIESVTVARYSVLNMFRYRMWFMNLVLGPFLTLAPLLFLAETVLGEDSRLAGKYFEGAEYSSYVGFIVIPMVAVGLTNTVFSWFGALIRIERNIGTLERMLVTLRYPASLIFGRALAHGLFLFVFAAATLGLVFIWARPDFEVNIPAAVVVISLHVLATYGMAFAFASLLLRMEDSFFFQSFVSKALLSILAGASFPIAVFPLWLQFIARAFPFTWAFELERAALLKNEPLSQMVLGVTVLASMTALFWFIGFTMLGRELDKAKKTGVFGGY